MYQRKNGEEWRHVWVAGDIHGCYQSLMDELKRRHFNPYEDLLISVGDIIDRGPDSLKASSYCMKNGSAQCGVIMNKWPSTVWKIMIFHSGR